MNTLTVKNVSFTYEYGFQQVLTNLNLDLKEGEFVVLMGKSGAGKSTLCRTLNLLIPNFYKGDLEGWVEVSLEPIIGKRVYEIAQRVGVVFQDYESQLFSTSVELECAFGPANLSYSREEIKILIQDSLLKVGLTDFRKRDPSTLSNGEKQRLTIASVLSINPKILVMDEPTSDLDPQGKAEIFAVCELLKQEGITVFLVENDAEQVLSADKILLLDKGEIVLEGKPEDVLRKVRLLEKCGIRPFQVAKLCQEIGYRNKLPVTVYEAAQIFQDEKYHFLENRYNVLKYKDSRRIEEYGNVIFEIRDLEYGYSREDLILDGIDIEIKKGEFIAIVGQNGSGKTTLLKHLNGLLKPLKGEILYLKTDIKGLKNSDLAKEIGYVFQNPDNQLFADTIFDEVSSGLKNLGFPSGEIPRRVAEALTAVELDVYERDNPFSLIKGDRQKLACASVLATSPQVIILDEPTTGLDYQEILVLMNFIVELNQKGHTIIMATNSMWIVAEYSHRTIVLNEGRVVMDNLTRKVFLEREILRDSHLLVPDIVDFSQYFGLTLLSVDEAKFCMGK